MNLIIITTDKLSFFKEETCFHLTPLPLSRFPFLSFFLKMALDIQWLTLSLIITQRGYTKQFFNYITHNFIYRKKKTRTTL